jgi:hypothetical protein
MYRIFISGPYTQGDVSINVRTAMNISNDLMNHGFAPYCPHLTHFLQISNPQPYEKWLELDMHYLVLCDAVYRFPGDSQGADDEVKLAIEKGIPVYYSIKELYKELL